MRYITAAIKQDLQKKMVFIGGPRQVGKTTLAKKLLSTTNGRYFNWDYDQDRHNILQHNWSNNDDLLIFDELHKFPRWKSWIKGIYDVVGNQHSILVTGSARLDVYRRGGDSLLGRYHYWRLHPFTLDEAPVGLNQYEVFDRLMTLGGFPEPFVSGDLRESRRWRRERFDRVLREDIRDLESIKNLQGISLLVDLLRTRVGGMIVVSNLAQDLQVASQTVKSWLDILERMYLIFRVLPYTQSIPRAILKPAKVYFFDNADTIDENGARFENFIATTLLKRLHYLEDYEGYRYELRYIRDKEGREIDFVILKDGIIEELIEVKYSDESLSRSLNYYANKLQVKKTTQIVANLKQQFDRKGISITNHFLYFSNPPWLKN